MKNILKVVGLSLSAALSCSADKCILCNINEVEDDASNLCMQCKAEHTCSHCGTFSETLSCYAVSSGLCQQCESFRCSNCGMISSDTVESAEGKLCDQCRQNQQNPFGEM